MSEGKLEEGVCEDKISELPDDLLVAILSHVPTKDAVATMLLSKRWVSVWTMIPILEYRYKKESRNSIWWFLHKSLQYHKAPVVDTLSVVLGPQCPTDVDVGECVANVVDRGGVRVIKFGLVWSAYPKRLPNSLYSCESLRELTLSHNILVDFPYSSCLPSLNELYLFSVVYKDDDSLHRFLSTSCPVLKALFVVRRKYDNLKTVTVKVPSLTCLFYDNSFMNNDVEEDNGRCLVIDTPALEDFHVIDTSRDYCSTNHMPCLKGAYLSSNRYPDGRLLKSFSSLLSLQLCFDLKTLVWCNTVNFSQLIKLRIYTEDSDWLEPLMLLLGNAPKLRNLTVDDAFRDQYEDVLLTWNQPNYVPGCLSSQLEIFEWIEYEDGEKRKNS